MDKLYYQDEGMLSFTAEVLAEQQEERGWRYLLDRSAFYPGGGGQPADRGWLNDIPLIGVAYIEGQIWHKLEQRLPARGDGVVGLVDAQWRREYQQQHSGQHLLSALLFRRGGETVSVRLGSQLVSIELTGSWFDREQLWELEDEANHLIVQRRRIVASFPEPEALATLPLRRESKVSNNIRVVEIEGVDCTPCGGVHCAHLGEVGLVRFFGEEKIRGHQRLHWLVGDRAHRHHRDSLRWLDQTGSILAVPAERIPQRCQQILREQAELQQQLKLCEQQLARALLARLRQHTLVWAHETEGDDAVGADQSARLRLSFRLCGELARALAHAGASTLVVWNDEQGGQRWFCCSRDQARGAALTEELRQLGARGGGKAPLWQGGMTTALSEEQARRLAAQLAAHELQEKRTGG